MAQPARAIDPFTMKQIRKRQEIVTALLRTLKIECEVLKLKAAPFIPNLQKDDLDELGIEMLERWLEHIQSALPMTPLERVTNHAFDDTE